jgi:DNA invertase Pin-like site-specific DNA recombinase
MNCIIYSRVSTEDQDNGRQINELKEYVKYKKYNLLAVFQEKVTGASKASERIEFSRMLDFISKNEVNHVLVWELSRLGRKMVDVVNTIEYFNDKKINIYSKKEGFNTLNDRGEKELMTTMLIGILSSFSELERETIKQRSKSGIRKNVMNGGSGTGVLKPYGFKKVGKKLVIDDKEEEIVKLIFTKYLEGLGTKQIANYLNEKNVPTRYNKLFSGKEIKLKHYQKKGSDFTWVDGTIYSILKNPIYKGKRLHKGETFEIDNIIDEETFDKVQLILKSKFNRKDINRKYTNIFKEKIICGKCGKSYFLHKRFNNNDNAYKCLSRRYNHSCGNPSISIDKLNNAVYNMMVSQVLNTAKINREQELNKLLTRLSNINIEIESSVNALSKINKQEKNLIKLRISESISMDNFTTLQNNLVAEKNLHDKKLEKLNLDKAEQEGLMEKLKNIDNLELTDVNLFKQYVNESIEFIKVEEIDHSTFDFLAEEYPNKQDIILLITIKALFNDYQYKTIISQRSNIQYMFVRATKKQNREFTIRSEIGNDIKID